MFSVKTMLVAEKLHNESVPVCNSADQFDTEKVSLLLKDCLSKSCFKWSVSNLESTNFLYTFSKHVLLPELCYFLRKNILNQND